MTDAGLFNESTDCIHYESAGKIRQLALLPGSAYYCPWPYPPLPPKPQQECFGQQTRQHQQ